MSDDAFVIEDQVPFPGPQRTASGRRATYPFRKLVVGQSFFVRSEKRIFSAEPKLCAAFHKARQTTKYNFAWAREEGGFRIYRLEGVATIKHRLRPHDEAAHNGESA